MDNNGWEKVKKWRREGGGRERNNTCKTEAPLWRNCKALSAESMPPVAKIGKPGRALAIAETARRAIGLMAFPV